MPVTVFEVPFALNWSPTRSPRLAGRPPTQHDLVGGCGGVRLTADHPHAEVGQLAGVDADLDEDGVLGVDVLDLHQDADGALHSRGGLDPGQLPVVDGAREGVRGPLLRHREIGLADRDDPRGRLLEATARDGQGDHDHDRGRHGERQAQRPGLLRPHVAPDQRDKGHQQIILGPGREGKGPSSLRPLSRPPCPASGTLVPSSPVGGVPIMNRCSTTYPP